MSTRGAKKETLKLRRDEFIERLKPELVRLSNELHDGQYAPNRTEYDLYGVDVIDKTTVSLGVAGKWADVAAACGLEVASFKYYYQCARGRKVEWSALRKTRQPTDDDLALTTRRTFDGIPCFDKPRRDVAHVPGVGEVKRWAWMVR